MLTKKDYIAFAKMILQNTINVENPQYPDDNHDFISTALVDDLIEYFKSDNPNFNEDRFRAACGENKCKK